MRVRSIRFRLAAWFTALLAAILLTAAIGAWFALRESIHSMVEKDLRIRMVATHKYLEKLLSEQDNVSLAETLEEDAAQSPAGPVFRIASSGKWIHLSGGWDSNDAAGDFKGRAMRTVSLGGKPFRVLTAPFRSGPDLWQVEIAAPLEELYGLLNHATLTALLASPLLMLLTAMGGYWIAGRALAG